ncbi:hypothetical protein JXA05_02185 [Candidatus Peregrinibacteria bacterium]|nr:hypothetical protein [Candidatus Peregrinibacteria bacterium]
MPPDNAENQADTPRPPKRCLDYFVWSLRQHALKMLGWEPERANKICPDVFKELPLPDDFKPEDDEMALCYEGMFNGTRARFIMTVGKGKNGQPDLDKQPNAIELIE